MDRDAPLRVHGLREAGSRGFPRWTSKTPKRSI
jgi:hypothetical protein